MSVPLGSGSLDTRQSVNAASKRLYPWLFEPRDRPTAIAHRGASAYAFDNSTQAFTRAALLGAEWIEVDLRTTADGVVVAWHDPSTRQLDGLARPVHELTFAELRRVAHAANRELPCFDTVLDIARSHDLGVYVDAKDVSALHKAPKLMARRALARGIIASFNAPELAALKSAGCAYPTSMLVPRNGNWSALARGSGADVVHLCGLHQEPHPQERITPALLAEASARALAVVLWHEERRHVLDVLLGKPVFGILSNKPEMLTASSQDRSATSPALICHRGIRQLAPENTVPAAAAAYSAGYPLVALEVRSTRDGEAVILADPSVDRTTNGSGAVADFSIARLATLDAGSWFDAFYKHVTVPLLSDMLRLARAERGGLYLDLKAVSLSAVIASAAALGALDRCIFGLGDPEHCRALRAVAPEARIVYRRSDFPTLASVLGVASEGPPGASIIAFDACNDPLIELQSCHAAACPTLVTYLGNDPILFERIASLRPSYLHLDRPDLWRGIRPHAAAPHHG